MKIFDWERLLFNDLPPIFLIEIVFRCIVMFIVVLMALKLTGKRGVRQLSVFELVIIITLGSAAGDPMFYEDVGLLPAITVFVCIIIMYRLVTYLTSNYKPFEHFIEGKPVIIIKEGLFEFDKFKKEDLAQDEFFQELRLKSVAHLGQVQLAILETNGGVSIFYFSEKDTKYGLPITPDLFNSKSMQIGKEGFYACTFCGNVDTIKAGKNLPCKRCERNEWVPAINKPRIV